MTTNTPFVSLAAPTPADASAWAADLQTLLDHLGRHFARSETRAHLRAYPTGLLSPLERKSWQRWLVARRGLTNPDDPHSIAYFLVFAPVETSLATLAQVIGERWGIECAFLAVTRASTLAPAPLAPTLDEGKKGRHRRAV